MSTAPRLRGATGSGWLRYRADRRSVMVVGLTLALLLVPQASPLSGGWAAAWLIAACLACFLASLVAHNHMHCPTFRAPLLNAAFDVALSIARGHTASGIVVPHNLNHHRLAGAAGDWIRPQLAGKGLGWLRLLRYVGRASANMLQQRRRPGAPRLSRRRQARLRLEQGVLAITITLLTLHDLHAFLLFAALPWLVGLGMLVGVNLLQHDRCEPGHRLAESRNFVGSIGNWLCFNNGFHTAHHLEPARHWSELPASHLALRSALPRTDLEQASILAFLWRFGWSRTPGQPSP